MNKAVTKHVNCKITFKVLRVILKYLIFTALSIEIFHVLRGCDNGDCKSLKEFFNFILIYFNDKLYKLEHS